MDLSKEHELLQKIYGKATAQEIFNDMEQLEKQTGQIDYLQFKALSELVEISRSQAMMGLWHLVDSRIVRRKDNPQSVDQMKQLEQQAVQALSFYQKATRLFYKIYDREMVLQEDLAAATYATATFSGAWSRRANR